MKLLLGNSNILTDNLADKIKKLIIHANIDNSKIYDIEIQFCERIIIKEEMYDYFVNKVPNERYKKYKNYEDTKGIEDGDVFVGDILSYILDNIRSEISGVINIFHAKISGYGHIREDNIKISLVESDQADIKNGMKVRVTMPSYTYFINTAMNAFKQLEESKKRELEYQKKQKKKLEKKSQTSTTNKLDDIAQQLGVSKDRLQAFLDEENKENKD